MDSIEGRFTIMVNGLAVTTAEDNADPKVHAAVGRDPAIFTLTRGRLESGDWILGRSLIEDRSLLPKGIYWFKKTSTDVELVQQSTAIPEAGSYKLMFAGSPMIVFDNFLFADLMQDQAQDVRVSLI